MQCLVLAGGLGTRVQTINGKSPKALLKIGSKAFIDWQMQWLKLIGISDVVLALAHGSDEIIEHIEKVQIVSDYPQINYSFDGPELLGTGGAVKKALPMLGSDFLVTYGDGILFLNATDFFRKHLEEKKGATLSIMRNEDLGDKSNVQFAGSEILRYDKLNTSSEMHYIDYGMTAVNKKYFSNVMPEVKSDFSKFLTSASEERQLASFVVTELFQEIGSPAGYERFSRLLKSLNYDLKLLAREKLNQRF